MVKALSRDVLGRGERLWMQGLTTQARTEVQRARMACHAAGDIDAEAQAVLLLGEMDLADGDIRGARARFVEARRLLVRAGDSRHQGGALMSLGRAAEAGGRDDGRVHFEAAVRHYQAAGDQDGEGRALLHLAQADRLRGADDFAFDHVRRARALFHHLGDGLNEARALRLLAALHAERHESDLAHAGLTEALTLYRQYGDVLEEGGALAELGTLMRRLGDRPAATDALSRAEQLFAACGNLEGEADVLMELALLEQERDPAHARRHYEHAARLFAGCGLEALGAVARDAADKLGKPAVVH